jgi:beta-glucosidase/6-phospho-beta-glucosidase/beta-galactosidase
VAESFRCSSANPFAYYPRKMAGDLKFPENFLWGTATSPTQVEGHVVNEWTDYVAADGGHCRVACDHYHRYEEDVDWMRSSA